MTLKQFIKKNRLSQVDCAAKFGVSPRRLCHWVAGKARPSTLELMLRIGALTCNAVTWSDWAKTGKRGR